MASKFATYSCLALLSVAGAGALQAQSFQFAYLVPPDNNTIPLFTGGTIQFPSTPVNSSTLITVLAVNQGTAPGTISSVTLSGAAFQLNNLPLLPATVAANGTFQFSVRFSPVDSGTSTGVLHISANGQFVTFNLQGSGTNASFQYQAIVNGASTSLLPNQTLTVPDTNVGEKTSIAITVKNNGTGAGTISTLSATGQDYLIANAPVLPLILAPGASSGFTLVFQPSAPGILTGRLQIGNDLFNLSGTGLGGRLSYSLTIASFTTTLSQGGALIFPPTQVGQQSSGTFSVQNTGTLAAHIISIGLDAGNNSSFKLSGLPALPVNLNPGVTVSFAIVFAPVSTGFATDNLRVDGQTFGLSGNGTTPVALPTYQFSLPSGNTGPLQQPSIGLSLASPYPLTVTGTLTLTLNPDGFVSDPAVQFATGGRTVSFTIPANTTDAVFANQTTHVLIQTGTVSGTIILSPTFATGNVNLTPASAPSLTLTVPRSAPVLTSLELASQSATSLSVTITGFATGRSLNEMDFQFAPAPNMNLQTTKLAVNVAAPFTAWYQSSASGAFGSLFSATVLFNLQGTVATGASLLDAIQSISVTVSNEQGSSGTLTLSLR